MSTDLKVILAVLGLSTAIIVGVAFFGDKGLSNDNTADAFVDSSILIREDSLKINVPASKVTIVEFLDFECEACRVAHPILKQILKEYEGRITFVLRIFPLHSNSVLAASAVESAAQQGKLWQMYDKLFEQQTEWGEKQTPQTELFTRYAQELGLNMEQFQAGLTDKKFAAKIERDRQDGIRAGVKGTPTIFLNGIPFQGIPTYNELKNKIEAELSK